MTTDQLARLTDDEREMWERCEKATGGQWQTRYLYRVITSVRRFAHKFGLLIDTSFEQDWSDCEFVSHARIDLPASLHTIADLRKEVARLIEENARFQAQLTLREIVQASQRNTIAKSPCEDPAICTGNCPNCIHEHEMRED